jgi:hypothetical protein
MIALKKLTLRPPPCDQPAPVPILSADADPGDHLGTGIEAEWIRGGYSTPLGDCTWWFVDFSPEEVWLDVTELGRDFDQDEVWFVPVNINVNPGRYPYMPQRVTLRAKCVEVVRVNCRSVARFQLEWRA